MTEIDDKYASLGGAGGFLGAPTAVEQASADGEGAFRVFTGGTIYWHRASGAHEVHGSILARYRALGAETGVLGYPTTDESTTPDGIGRYNQFRLGSIYWHPATGAHDVQGRITEAWALLAWERDFLGYPISDQIIDAAGVARSRFQGGWISWDSGTDELRRVRCPNHASPNFQIPVYAIRASDNNGNRPADITPAQVQSWLDRANRVFEVAGIEFTYDGLLHDLNNTNVNSVTGIRDPNWSNVKSTLDTIAATAQSLVIAFRFGPGPGQTGGGFSWNDYRFVIMPGFNATGVAGVQNISLLAHEIGHYLGLPHTHGPDFDTVEEARQDFITHGRDPSRYDGDRAVITDTPPYPHIGSLATNWVTSTVVLGDHAFLLARDNVMSYYHPDALLSPRTLSRQQIHRVREHVGLRRAEFDLNVREIWGDGAEIQVYGRSYNQYRQKYDAIWPAGWRLSMIRPYSTGSSIRYSAAWEWESAQEIQVYGWSYADYRQKYDELWPLGWRLHQLQPFVHAGQIRYTAVWRKGRHAEIQVYGWTYSKYRSEYDQMWPQGWRLHLIKPYVNGSQLRYTAVWRKARYAERQVYGWTYSSFRREYNRLWPQGWRLTHLEPHVINNIVRYTAVWRRSTVPEIQLYDVTYNSYRAKYDELWPLGWRLKILAPYVIGGRVRYTAVWKRFTGSASFVCGASTTP